MCPACRRCRHPGQPRSVRQRQLRIRRRRPGIADVANRERTRPTAMRPVDRPEHGAPIVVAPVAHRGALRDLQLVVIQIRAAVRVDVVARPVRRERGDQTTVVQVDAAVPVAADLVRDERRTAHRQRAGERHADTVVGVVLDRRVLERKVRVDHVDPLAAVIAQGRLGDRRSCCCNAIAVLPLCVIETCENVAEAVALELPTSLIDASP